MHCDQVPLIELLGSELESSRTEQALAHVEGCPACRERLQTMAAVKALHDSDLVRCTAGSDSGPWPRPF